MDALKLTEREFNTSVFLLRVVQVGLKMSDLDFLNYGEVLDIIIESGNDSYEYKSLPTQDDYDKF